jgi:hypothetical protein
MKNGKLLVAVDESLKALKHVSRAGRVGRHREIHRGSVIEATSVKCIKYVGHDAIF